MPSHPSLEKFKKYFNSQLVGIDERDHQELIAKHGEDIVLQAYSQLAEWKLSKAEVEPKAVTKHTDIQRIKKWVLKEVLANPQPVSNLASKRKWAIKIDHEKEDTDLLKYAMNTKPVDVENAIALFYCKKNNIEPESPPRMILWKLKRGEVNALERELAQAIENKG